MAMYDSATRRSSISTTIRTSEVATEVLARQDDRISLEPFEDGAAAPSRIASGGVNCVVTDFKMADRDGLDFLRESARWTRGSR